MSSNNETCCPTTTKPVVSGYEAKGTRVVDPVVGSYYAVGEGPRGVVYIADIFGVEHPNVFKVSDFLASRGFHVIAPDVYRGEPWPASKFPPKEEDNFGAFIARLKNVEPFVADTEYAAKLLRERGATSVGAIGFCAGAKFALAANSRGVVSCAVGPHPSFLDVEDGKGAKGPVCLLPAHEDPPLLDVKEALEAQPFGAKCVFQRFNALSHGFLGARGQFEVNADGSNAEIVKETNEALEVVVKFFQDNL